MACQEIQSWTFSALVGAFLDIAIAYLLLCASALAYFASKFLGLFGLCLPCPCNGLFGDPDGDNCWQKVLVDSPSEKISSVQFSVKRRFPFDSNCGKNMNSQLTVNLINQRNRVNRCGGFDGEVSGSSFQERSEMGFGSGLVYMGGAKGEKSDMNGNEVSSRKVSRGLRCRRKVATNNRRFSSVLYPLQSYAQALPQSPASVNEMVIESNEGSIGPVNSGDDGASSIDMGLPRRVSDGFNSDKPVNQSKLRENGASPADDWKHNVEDLCFEGDEKNMTKDLKQALVEECAACAALYLELEKERSAAATAADEAMAMILRLQEEKASIEMEARQYQRMIEEKSAYDLEEMNVLKEILLRREREKHFLEKEVEAYRQMIFENERLDSDMQDIGTARGKRASFFLYSGQDPVMTLQRISECIGENENLENADKFSEHEVRPSELQNSTLALGDELPIPAYDEVDSLKQGHLLKHPSTNKLHQQLSSGNERIKEEFQEKNTASQDKNSLDQEREVQGLEVHSQCNLSATQGYNLHEKTLSPIGEIHRQSDSFCASQWLSSKTTEICDETKIVFPYNSDDTEKHGKGVHNAVLNMGPSVLDVYVVDDKFNMCTEVNDHPNENLSVNSALDVPRTSDSPIMSSLEMEHYISRSCSDITRGLPPMVCSRGKPLLSDWRRNSMSAVDYERLKIDNEVGWLRERLRIIREGREKLNISMGHREKEKNQLQLLENIVNQLQEIRQLTETGKAVREASLPLSSCKATSKKRRWRSVSLGVHRSP